jgi:hypothetical protein
VNSGDLCEFQVISGTLYDFHVMFGEFQVVASKFPVI